MNKLHKFLVTPYHKAKGYYPVTIDGIPFKLDPYHINYWRNVGKMRWEPETFKVLSTYLNPDSTYVDIGAWIGPTVLYAAKKCKKVICFEPDQAAFKFLRWNIELNDIRNVMAFNLAIATETGIQRMASFGELGDSMTSLLNNDSIEQGGIDVMTKTFDDFQQLVPLNKVDLLKIDIEGGEFDLLPALKPYLAEYKPTLWISTHTPFVDENLKAEKMQTLIDALDMYDECYDDHLNRVELKAQNNPEIHKHFHCYLLKAK